MKPVRLVHLLSLLVFQLHFKNENNVVFKLSSGLPTKAAVLVKKTMVQILSHGEFFAWNMSPETLWPRGIMKSRD